jgi:CRISPR/Cas system CSM-associated protein Csm2 small subunit
MSRVSRARADESAERVNSAVALQAIGLSVAEASRRLAHRHRLSERQARRYVERARDRGPMKVPGPKQVLTVKLSGALVHRLKACARRQQRTFSSLVAEALEELLDRTSTGPPSG